MESNMIPETGRFDYVRYDEEAAQKQAALKGAFRQLETLCVGMWKDGKMLPDGRAKSLVLTKLEEAYMWVGKAIRDEQLAARGAEEQPQRATE